MVMCQHVFHMPCIYPLLLSVMCLAGHHIELMKLGFRKCLVIEGFHLYTHSKITQNNLCKAPLSIH